MTSNTDPRDAKLSATWIASVRWLRDIKSPITADCALQRWVSNKNKKNQPDDDDDDDDDNHDDNNDNDDDHEVNDDDNDEDNDAIKCFWYG
jgi:ABC-type Zn2+ transport system substrate-binding protein/surface adhesin